ncbi:hypothetical protein FRC09_002051 [Ceratobasidium sp. 395]|nr:hypothetical protein FRC09_002051 [Ceratobasidium sp. 395]
MKNFNAHFSHLISVVLVARLTLHLRSEGIKQSRASNTSSTMVPPTPPTPAHIRVPPNILGNAKAEQYDFGKDFASEMEMGGVRFTRAGRVSDAECQRAPEVGCVSSMPVEGEGDFRHA